MGPQAPLGECLPSYAMRTRQYRLSEGLVGVTMLLMMIVMRIGRMK
jgi:hypothetical protein